MRPTREAVMERFKKCVHSWYPFFGPVLKCYHCNASTMYSMDGHPKPIIPPTVNEFEEEAH